MENRIRYAIGDLVIPADLPRTFVCSVVTARPIGTDGDQLLELAPRDGPWPPGTQLIRLNEMVRPARPSEVGQAQHATSPHGGQAPTRRRPSLRIVTARSASAKRNEQPSPKVA